MMMAADAGAGRCGRRACGGRVAGGQQYVMPPQSLYCQLPSHRVAALQVQRLRRRSHRGRRARARAGLPPATELALGSGWLE